MKELKILKQIKLTEEEKQGLSARLTDKIGFPPQLSGSGIVSPFYKLSFFLQGTFVKVGVLAVLILSVSGATAYASRGALPGDLLYPIKTKVVERVADLAARSPEAKAKRNSRNIETRIKEYEALQGKGRLTEKNATEIELDIDRNHGDFGRNIKNIKKEYEDSSEQSPLQIELESRVRSHRERVKKMREEKKEEEGINDSVEKRAGYKKLDLEIPN